jgi:hypothetical protein
MQGAVEAMKFGFMEDAIADIGVVFDATPCI